MERSAVESAVGRGFIIELKSEGGYSNACHRRLGVIRQKLYKIGNSYFVPIPRQEVARLGLREGQLLELEIRPAQPAPAIAPEILEAFEASWARYEEENGPHSDESEPRGDSSP